MDNSRIAAFRFLKSGLLNGFPSVSDCIRKHFGIQAQMKQVPFIAIALRTLGTTLSQLNSMIQCERILVRIWGLRTTFHYYAIDDWALVCSFLQEKPNWFERRMRNRGIDYDSLYKDVVSILTDKEFISREILVEHGISSDYLGPWGDIFISLNNNGLICNSSSGAGNAVYANRNYWCPNLPFKLMNYNLALSEIVIRYFSCFGPATISDFLHWSGMSNSHHNHSIVQKLCISLDELTEYEPDLWGDTESYLQYHQLDASSILNEHIFLLGKFDPLLLAYQDKSWIISDEYKSLVWRKAGHVSAALIIGGKICGTWTYKQTSKKVLITITIFKKCNVEFDKLKKPLVKIAELLECNMIECILNDLSTNQKWEYSWEI